MSDMCRTVTDAQRGALRMLMRLIARTGWEADALYEATCRCIDGIRTSPWYGPNGPVHGGGDGVQYEERKEERCHE